MFKPEIICVTQSTICENFLNQIEKVCIKGIDRIILREKHLPENEYYKLAIQVKNICDKYNIPLTLHNFPNVALDLNIDSFHCSYAMLKENVNKFKFIGVSVHTLEESINAEKIGASYITAGHVFKTQCKAGLEPKGIEFISEICQNVNIPVYAIGGINADNINLLENTGIKGICMMSSLMTCK